MGTNKFDIDYMVDALFNEGYNEDDVQEAVDSLIKKGLLEPVTVGEDTEYRLTSTGYAVCHHMTSDPALRN